MKGRLLGLAGKAGSGKSTVAQALVDRGLAQRVRFAGPLKDGLVAMGLSREQVDGGLKETPSDLLCGCTPRHAMMTLGTDWGRNMIGPDLWVRLAMHRVDELLSAGVNVVIDDVRFDNEAAAILARGGRLVTLERQQSAHTSDHTSEAGLTCPTCRVANDGALDRTVDEVLALFGDVANPAHANATWLDRASSQRPAIEIRRLLAGIDRELAARLWLGRVRRHIDAASEAVRVDAWDTYIDELLLAVLTAAAIVIGLGYDLNGAIEVKLAYNRTRPQRHGDKRA